MRFSKRIIDFDKNYIDYLKGQLKSLGRDIRKKFEKFLLSKR